jgi:hypothetical protein
MEQGGKVKCENCAGTGYLHYDDDFSKRRWCGCQLGRDAAISDLQAENRKIVRKPRSNVIPILKRIHERGF